jgi:soluble lytic murein transglycosylase-like protein
MALSWLPYGGTRRSEIRPPRFPFLGFLSLLVRPPARFIQPAVAIPFVVAGLLAASISWALHPAPAAALSLAASDPARVTLASAPTIASAFPQPVQARAPDIHRWAEAYGLQVNLVAVVMTLESCGDPSARSVAGAQGLFQVMPFHFADGEDPLDPETNARRGLSYLSRGLELAGGNTALALAGYNGGHGLIQRDPAAWPAETTRYVNWGKGILADLDAGDAGSPTLQAWLDAGGAHLCRVAAARQSG